MLVIEFGVRDEHVNDLMMGICQASEIYLYPTILAQESPKRKFSVGKAIGM